MNGAKLALRMLGVALASVAVSSLDVAAEPSPLEAAGTHAFAADFLVFYEQDSEEALVWMAVNVPLTSLFFEPGKESADLLVSWKVRRGSGQVDGDVLVKRVTVPEADRAERHVLEVIPIHLKPGRYVAEIEVGQPGADQRSRASRDLRIEPMNGSAFLLSSLYLSADSPSKAPARSPSPPAFPLVGRVVNEDVSTLGVVGELYAPVGCRERYRVTYRLVDEFERTLQERTEEVPCEGFRTALRLPLDTGSLGFGDFRVEVGVKIPQEGHELYRELWFSADETLLSMKGNFAKTLEVIEMIATKEELAALEEAPPEKRAEAWESFWQSRDPSPNTKINEYRVDFFRRVRFANQHFGTSLQPGWKTDRGRVLLEHGHPDRIERGSSSPGQSAWEVWFYQSAGLEFRFVDEIGLGDFRLVSRL